MKAKLIVINWTVSFMGLCIDTEHSPLWAVTVAVIWFAASSLLLKYAARKGWTDKIVKHCNTNEK